MSATLGPSWNLRSNASPRCLTAYVTQIKSSTIHDSGRGNADIGNSGYSITGGESSFTASSSNPFDDDLSTSVGGGGGGVGSGGVFGGETAATGGGGPNSGSYIYSVAFGTERGSLHYRAYPQYPPPDQTLDHNIDDGNLSLSSSLSRSGRSFERGYEHDRGYDRSVRDPSQLVIAPLSDGEVASSSTSSSYSGISSTPSLGLYGSINLQGAVKGSIVGLIRAYPVDFTTKPISENFNAPMSSFQSHPPVFLLLVDDNRGSASSSSSNPGAYASHLVTVKHGAFIKLPAAPANFSISTDPSSIGSSLMPDMSGESVGVISGAVGASHRRGGSSGGSVAGMGPGSSVVSGGAGGGLTNWFGGDSASNINTSSQPASNKSAAVGTSPGGIPPATGTGANTPGNSMSIASLGPLPRMSCATYHPHAGYVYAAGTGIHGLPESAATAVLAGMLGVSSSSSSLKQHGHLGGGHGSTFRDISSLHHSSTASTSSSSQTMRRGHGAATTSTLTNPTLHQTKIMPPIALYLKCQNALPQPGVRCSSGGGSKNSMTLACGGRVAIVAVTNAFYAIPACLDLSTITGGTSGASAGTSSLQNITATKLLAFAQSSQVHPVISMEVMSHSDRIPVKSVGSTAITSPPSASADSLARYHLRSISSLVVLASGRECTAVEVLSIPDANAVAMVLEKGGIGGGGVGLGGGSGVISTSVKITPPRNRIATLPSPILAAASLPPRHKEFDSGEERGRKGRRGNAGGGRGGNGKMSSGPFVALLTVDGLIHIRSPFCIGVPLSSIEVGTRPNDFFSLSSLPSQNIIATSYGGEARMVLCHEETSQDFADRLIKLAIDAFGSNGFPRLELAEALGATFSATSYSGPEPTAYKRSLLRQYLESMLGLADDVRLFMGGDSSVSSFVVSEFGMDGLEVENAKLESDGDQEISSSLGPNALLTGTALLCLVCFQLDPPNGALALRSSKACSDGMGIVRPKDSSISKAAIAVCELVADRLAKEASASFSLLNVSPSISSSNYHSKSSSTMEFVESAVWLLRSCGCHEKAVFVLQERMNCPAFRNSSVGIGVASGQIQGWSQIKFDSYIATHLSELWSSNDDKCCQLVLRSSATRDLIERNPMLGLSIFTTPHPQNEREWRNMRSKDDPLFHLLYPSKVVELLKSVAPDNMSSGENSSVEAPGITPSFSTSYQSGDESGPLPLTSGRALAVLYLESAIGIATGRPSPSTGEPSFHLESRDETDDRKADMHDELSYLLLEGVISERGDGDEGEDSDLGAKYRYKLRRLLSWSGAKVRSERLLASLPSSFLREHALLLGRLGRHEDALRIFYSDLNSLELALEYCDVRHERYQAKVEEAKARGILLPHECSYIPLVKVALDSDPESDRGIAAAIQVLALRRDSIDKGAALQLLPKNVPMSSVVRPFLIPAIVENESQVRRLTVASSLLRSKYLQLKQKLTEAQLEAQSSLHSVPALKKFNLGNPLYSSKPLKARPVHAASPFFPDVMIVKHFFPRHLVIQAQVGNTFNHGGSTLADVAFVIAESSDESLHSTLEVPLRTLPSNSTGSAWCVLTAAPQRLDGTAFLTCELRYTVLAIDAATGAPLSFSGGANAPGFGRTYVEELQDIEVRHTEFSP